MAGIRPIQKRPSGLDTLGKVVGTVVGAATGLDPSGSALSRTAGAVGAAQGASSLGTKQAVQPVQPVKSAQSSVQRRLFADTNVNGVPIADILRNAEVSLQHVDENIRKQYAPIIGQAIYNTAQLVRAGLALPPSHLNKGGQDGSDSIALRK